MSRVGRGNIGLWHISRYVLLLLLLLLLQNNYMEGDTLGA